MELRVFKPSVWSRLSFFIWGTIGAAFVGYLLTLLANGVRINQTQIHIGMPIWVGPAVAILIEVFVLYHVFFGNRVRFEVEGQSFRYIDCFSLSARQLNKMWELLLERGLVKVQLTLDVQP